jgi:2'-5' RNA ligase
MTGQTIKSIDTLYSNIHAEGVKALRDGKENIDYYLRRMEQDSRRGLALLVNLSGHISNNFGFLVKEMKAIEPKQYYYPETDLHMTVLDLISASANCHIDEDLKNKAMQIINFAILDSKPFEIEFRGIVLSNGAILIKGYYSEGLSELRDNIRRLAPQYDFELKERYQSISAHVTIGRFASKLENPEIFIRKIEAYRDYPIGVIQVNQLELVIHDWYNSRKNVLQKFFLK